MNKPAEYTHLESLFLVQSLLTEGVDADAFARVSEALTNNALVRDGATFDAVRLKPEALRQQFLLLMRDEVRRCENGPGEGPSAGAASPEWPKTKARGSSPAFSMIDAAQHVDKIPGLVDRLYTQYRVHIVGLIREDERQFKIVQSQIQGLDKIERERLAKAASAGQNNAAALAAREAAKPASASHAAGPLTAPATSTAVKRSTASSLGARPSAPPAALPATSGAPRNSLSPASLSRASPAPPMAVSSAVGQSLGDVAQTPSRGVAVTGPASAPVQSTKSPVLTRLDGSNRTREDSPYGHMTGVLKWEKPYKPRQSALAQSPTGQASSGPASSGPQRNLPVQQHPQQWAAAHQPPSAQVSSSQQYHQTTNAQPTAQQQAQKLLQPQSGKPPQAGPQSQQAHAAPQHKLSGQMAVRAPGPPPQPPRSPQPSPGVAASPSQPPGQVATPLHPGHGRGVTATPSYAQGRPQQVTPMVSPGLGRAMHPQPYQPTHQYHQSPPQQQLFQQQQFSQAKPQARKTAEPQSPSQVSLQAQAQQQQIQAQHQAQLQRSPQAQYPPQHHTQPQPPPQPEASRQTPILHRHTPKMHLQTPVPASFNHASPVKSPFLVSPRQPVTSATVQPGHPVQSTSQAPLSKHDHQRSVPPLPLNHDAALRSAPPAQVIKAPETPVTGHATSRPQTPRHVGPLPFEQGLGTKWAPQSTPSTPRPPRPAVLELESPAYEAANVVLNRNSVSGPSAVPFEMTPRSTFRKAMPKPSHPSDNRTPRYRSRGGADSGNVPSTPTHRRPRRSLSTNSQMDELSLDHSAFSTGVKNEAATPRGVDDMGDTTADESTLGRAHVFNPGGASARLSKRKRPETPSDVTGPPSHVLWTRGFTKVSSSALDQISSHRHANMFATGVREKDAPNYRQIVLQPQDITSIRSAIKQGNKAALQAASCLPGGGDPGTPHVWLPISEDLVPPRGIINSAQLERELVHIFCNAIMYNPDPNRGPGPGFLKRPPNEEEEVVGYHLDENGVVKNTRSMFVEVEKLLGDLRSAEKDRVMPAVRQSSVSAADDSAEDEDELAGDGGGSSAGADVGRRRVSMRSSIGGIPSSAGKPPS